MRKAYEEFGQMTGIFGRDQAVDLLTVEQGGRQVGWKSVEWKESDGRDSVE